MQTIESRIGVALLVGCFAGAFFGIGITHVVTFRDARQEAIEAGVAEWVVNPKTGETAFTYKKPKE
jgi:hypothetical protein